MLKQAEVFLLKQKKLTGLSKYVFLNNKNQLFSSSEQINKRFKKILQKINLTKRNIYQTRHTFASNMLSNKEDIFWVSQTMGHKNINTTVERYSKYIRKKRHRKNTFLDEENFTFVQN